MNLNAIKQSSTENNKRDENKELVQKREHNYSSGQSFIDSSSVANHIVLLCAKCSQQCDKVLKAIGEVVGGIHSEREKLNALHVCRLNE